MSVCIINKFKTTKWIAKTLSMVINEFFFSGFLPKLLKVAEVKSLFKEGEK